MNTHEPSSRLGVAINWEDLPNMEGRIKGRVESATDGYE
jgi:hypothetical protein